MARAITAMYAQDNDDWSITVAGLGEELTARAPGIIAARDRVDQLVEKIVKEEKGATVVHLLNGSALAFTSAYMTARLTRTTESAIPETETAEAEVPVQARTENDAAEPAVTGPTVTGEGTESGGSSDTGSKNDKPAAPTVPTVPTKELAKSPDEVSAAGDRSAKSAPSKGKSGQRDSRRTVAR